MKIFSWNVNGIRSVFRSSFTKWLQEADPDIVCLQEIKADFRELAEEYTKIDGYHAYFNSAAKKGYAGVAVYTKIKPITVETEIGIQRFDTEGRLLKLIFDDFILFNFYIPHGGRAKENLEYKLETYQNILGTIGPLMKENIILAGDFNIAHTEQDLYFPKQNENNIMFTPAEREQISALLRFGYTDTFRHIHPDKKSYTWWPYRLDLRERDIGWRLDYIFVSSPLATHIKDAFMQKETKGSDHCPYGVVIDKIVDIKEWPIYKTKKQAALI